MTSRSWSRARRAMAGLSIALGVSSAFAQPTTASLATKSLAATCAQCHGTDGRPVDGAPVPGLAGLGAGYFVEQMKAFRSGARPATVMHQIAKGYSDAQVDALATYFAAQPR